jgi:hypothetical protein
MSAVRPTSSTLRLYRHILRNARAFPSIKRDKLVQEIQHSFRANRGETDPDKLRVMYSVADKGLEQLMAYTRPVVRGNTIEVSLEEDPMPKPSASSFQRKSAANARTLPV